MLNIRVFRVKSSEPVNEAPLHLDLEVQNSAKDLEEDSHRTVSQSQSSAN